MAVLASVKVADLTILNTASVSNVLKAREAYEDAEELMLYAPAALGAATYTIEVTDDPDAAAPVFRTYQQGDTPTDVAPPVAGKARTYVGLASAMGIRLKSSIAEVADRVWKVSKQFRCN